MKDVDTKEQIKVFSGVCLEDKNHFIIKSTKAMHRLRVSPPTKTEHLSVDKCSVFVYPSRRLGISSRQRRVYHQGRLAALVSHHAPACILLRLDDKQHFVFMIYRNKLRMIYKANALIYWRKCDIINSSIDKNLKVYTNYK